MRLARPVYRALPACRGRSYDEIDQLTREVYRRNPRLAVYPMLVGLLVFPVAMWLPRQLAEWLGLKLVWSLSIIGATFGAALFVIERVIHRPAVNREMQAIIAERGTPPNGGPADLLGNSRVSGGPPSVS